jgi:hypothetical protein
MTVHETPPSDGEGRRGAIVRLNQWRDRYREIGFCVILGLQASIMFVVAPMAGGAQFSAQAIEALRFGLATTAILIVTRSRLIGAFVALTFVVSLLCLIYLKTGPAGQTTYLAYIIGAIAFDIAVAGMVAHAAFDAGRITAYRIMGAVILYLYIGLIFASVYR